MLPSPSDVHVNFLLTNFSIAWWQSNEDFIADKVFPVVPVQFQSNLYRIWDRDDWFRAEAQERAPATESAGGGFRLSQGQYMARVYAFHKDLDDRTRANSDPGVNLDRLSTEYVTRQMLLTREKIWADANFKTGVWGTDVAGVSGTPTGAQVKKWSVAGSTPIEDIAAWVLAMAKATGFKPNTVVMSPDVYTAIVNHASILERIKYTQRAIATTDLLAALWGVDRVYIPWGIINTAPEGTTGSYGFIYGSGLLLCYAAASAGLEAISAGYTFVWNGYTGMDFGTRMKRFRMEPIQSDRIEGEMAFDVKIVAPQLGIFFSALL